MSKNINETFEFERIEPEKLFSAFMESKTISDATGYDTSFGKKAGDEFIAFNGGVTGKILHVIPNSMIVVSWRWLTRKKDYADTISVMVFSKHERGTKLEISHINLPETEHPFITRDSYIDPVKNFIESGTAAAV
jgi:activator of HSP90 ATPase